MKDNKEFEKWYGTTIVSVRKKNKMVEYQKYLTDT